MDSVKIYSVGGSVRDALLGIPSSDEDFVVVGADDAYMVSHGYKSVGADFPVYLDCNGQEFALARTERKTGRGYNGFEVSTEAVSLVDDLLRRDLRINAIAKDLESGEVIDPFNGFRDLSNKVLRHVSAAFADDPVRVLRLARFHARYGDEWTVAPETMDFARKMVQDGELSFLTRERVLKEMEKALSEPAPHLFFNTLRACGALDVVFPELAEVNPELLAWTLKNFPSRSGRFNWAKLSVLVEHPENFEKRLNVTTHWRSFSKLFREATTLRNSHPVARLHAMDVYRQKGLWEALLFDSKEAGFNLSFLEEAYEASKHVCFDTLPEKVRETAVGKAISDAIAEQRRFAYDSAQRLKA